MQIYLLEIPQTLEVFCANNDVWVKYLTADEKHLLEPKNLAQMASILGKIAIRYLLKKYFPNEYTLQPFSKAQAGKPYFASLPNWHFNISHTKRWVAIAISDQEVGIDVEGIRSYKKEVAKRFFSSAEYLYLETVSLDKQDEIFTRLWTLKECYVKYTGTGISNNFSNFAISIKNEVIDIEGNEEPVFFKQYDYKGLFISICSVKNIFPKIINDLSFEELITVL